MKESQKAVCKICGEPERRKGPKGNIARLCIDHNHKTGKVRGLLCDNCNKALGHFKDNAQVVFNAYQYLMEII